MVWNVQIKRKNYLKRNNVKEKDQKKFWVDIFIVKEWKNETARD